MFWRETLDQHLLPSPSVLEMYKFMKSNDLQTTFPNIEILLRIYITIPASNSSGERSFSTLKPVKKYLRSTMGQQRLTALSILNIESKRKQFHLM